MLPAEEYAYLKRKYEAEKAAKLQAMQSRKPSYDAHAFAYASHGLSTPPAWPARKDSYWRMKPGQGIKPQPKYKQKAPPKPLPKKPRPKYNKPLPRKPVEYSSPQVRKNYAYKGSGMAGKAGEVLGVTDKRMYAGKPLPAPPKKAPKMKKPVVKNATKPLPKVPKEARKPKKSAGCVVILHSKLYDIAEKARAQDKLHAKRRRMLQRAASSQFEMPQDPHTLSEDCIAIVDFQTCSQDSKLEDLAQADGITNRHTSLSSWTILRAQISLLKKPHRNWQEHRQGQRAREKSERMLRAYDHVLATRRAKAVSDTPPRVDILWFDRPGSGLGLAVDRGCVHHAEEPYNIHSC